MKKSNNVFKGMALLTIAVIIVLMLCFTVTAARLEATNKEEGAYAEENYKDTLLLEDVSESMRKVFYKQCQSIPIQREQFSKLQQFQSKGKTNLYGELNRALIEQNSVSVITDLWDTVNEPLQDFSKKDLRIYVPYSSSDEEAIKHVDNVLYNEIMPHLNDSFIKVIYLDNKETIYSKSETAIRLDRIKNEEIAIQETETAETDAEIETIVEQETTKHEETVETDAEIETIIETQAISKQQQKNGKGFFEVVWELIKGIGNFIKLLIHCVFLLILFMIALIVAITLIVVAIILVLCICTVICETICTVIGINIYLALFIVAFVLAIVLISVMSVSKVVLILSIGIIAELIFIRRQMHIKSAIHTCDAIVYNDNINIATYSVSVKKILREMEVVKDVFVLDRHLKVQKMLIQNLDGIDFDSLDGTILEKPYSNNEILKILEIIDRAEFYKKVVVFSNIEITDKYVNTVSKFNNIKRIVVFSPKESYQKSFSKRFCKNAKTVIYYI